MYCYYFHSFNRTTCAMYSMLSILPSIASHCLKKNLAIAKVLDTQRNAACGDVYVVPPCKCTECSTHLLHASAQNPQCACAITAASISICCL